MQKLPVLSNDKDLRHKRVIVRVDWNVPLSGVPHEAELVKIKQSVDTIKDFSKRGAVVLVLTHLGRPDGWDDKYSTACLLPFAEAFLGKPIIFCEEDITTEDGLAAVSRSVGAAKAGDVYLLENVRFYPGEESNDKALAQTYGALGEIFVNDAFASCHRAHVSVSGIARVLPHFAGPNLVKEIEAADKLIGKPKRPFVAIVGGSKLSTKMSVIESLLQVADKVCIGGAMANAFFVAKRHEMGKSYVEKEGVKLAKGLLKNPKIVLPVDLLVAKKLDEQAQPKAVDVKEVKKTEAVGDIGPRTMRDWAGLIKGAQTIMWNGPVGISEFKPFCHGSLVVGQAVAMRSKGAAYGVVGGGDTVPVALETGMGEWFDHVSMGGGALLEYIAEKGELPGILALTETEDEDKKAKSKIRKSKIVEVVKKVKVVKAQKVVPVKSVTSKTSVLRKLGGMFKRSPKPKIVKKKIVTGKTAKKKK